MKPLLSAARHVSGPRLAIATAIAAMLSVAASPQAEAGQGVQLPGRGGVLQAPVTTYAQIRFRGVVRQQFDLSCGAAALATLLTHHWGVKVSEREIIESIGAKATAEQKKQISRSGFSMLELKRFGEGMGFAAGGFRIDKVEVLKELRHPAITLTNIRGYQHFAVIKGVRDGRVFIADPAFGNRVRTLEAFAAEWNNVILVLVSDRHKPEAGFKLEAGATSPTRELVTLLNPVLNNIRPLPGEF